MDRERECQRLGVAGEGPSLEELGMDLAWVDAFGRGERVLDQRLLATRPKP